MSFLRRDDDLLDVLLDRDERAGLDEVEATVLHEVFQRGPGRRELLDFVEDDERLTGNEFHLEERLDAHEEIVEVVEVFREELLDRRIRLVEVDDDIRLVFPTGELLDDPALADTASAINQEKDLLVILLFPVEQFVVDLALHLRFPYVSEVKCTTFSRLLAMLRTTFSRGRRCLKTTFSRLKIEGCK